MKSEYTTFNPISGWQSEIQGNEIKTVLLLILFLDLILIRLNAATRRCYAEGFYAPGVSYNREGTEEHGNPVITSLF